jgi:hypothetical protein
MICWDLTAFGWLVPCTKITSGKGTPGNAGSADNAGNAGLPDEASGVLNDGQSRGMPNAPNAKRSERRTAIRGSTIPKIEAGYPENGTTGGKAPSRDDLINTS